MEPDAAFQEVNSAGTTEDVLVESLCVGAGKDQADAGRRRERQVGKQQRESQEDADRGHNRNPVNAPLAATTHPEMQSRVSRAPRQPQPVSLRRSPSL